MWALVAMTGAYLFFRSRSLKGTFCLFPINSEFYSTTWRGSSDVFLDVDAAREVGVVLMMRDDAVRESRTSGLVGGLAGRDGTGDVLKTQRPLAPSLLAGLKTDDLNRYEAAAAALQLR